MEFISNIRVVMVGAVCKGVEIKYIEGATDEQKARADHFIKYEYVVQTVKKNGETKTYGVPTY